VTVWATEQSNMAKVAKWKRTAVPGAGLAAAAAAEAGSSTDVFVPWHLPFHRAEAAAAAAGAREAGGGEEGGPRVDASAGAVVFSRYYHLFAAGEREGLGSSLKWEGLQIRSIHVNSTFHEKTEAQKSIDLVVAI
jgi:alkylated DNA repair protein alkB family protein 8